MTSELDIVVLVTDQRPFVESDDWWSFLGEATFVHTRSWGALTECRIRPGSGFEIEFGFVAPSRAETEPVDPGTLRVVRDGMAILYDPRGDLRRLQEACSQA